MDHQDGYAGPAVVLVDGREIPVRATLAGEFDPVTGRFHWYGRVAAATTGGALFDETAAGDTVVLRTPHGQARTELRDVDPWGRPRVEGSGRPPFPVDYVDHVDSEDGSPAAASVEPWR